MSVSLISRRVARSRLRRSVAFLIPLALVSAVMGIFPGVGPISPAFAAGSQVDAYEANTIYAYALEGEEVVISGTPSEAIGGVTSPSGATFSGGGRYQATEDGVWSIDLTALIRTDGGYKGYDWSVDVESNGQIIPGRAWSYKDVLQQPTLGAGGSLADLEYWAVNDTGYVYSIKLNGYNGINSYILANAYGIADENCAPTYASLEYDPNGSREIPDCGETYRIFYEEPAADLPASAPSAEGEVTILRDALEVTDLEVNDLTFVSASAGSAAGTFTYSIDPRFSGTYELEIDVDGNGSYDDAVDRSILLTADGSGSYTYDFDGLDGNGDAIEDCTAMNARVFFDRVGEIHIVQGDVEGRSGGIEVTRLNGQGAPDSTIYWNDTGMPNWDPPRTTFTPELVGNGVNSSGGVHGWDYDPTGWGNNRHIDDWAYLPMEFGTGEIQVGGQCLEIGKTSDATEETRVGDTVNYTVTATNTGDADYTEDSPAYVFDDLSGVLDDAEYNADGAANQPGDVTFDDDLLAWNGALPAGESVELTYSVTLETGGDREVKNVAFVGDPENPGEETPECDPDSSQVACDEFELPALTIKKEADTTELPQVGETVTYTVTVENVGPGDYTIDNPATMTDDLSDVLDDATISSSDLDSSTGQATIDGNTLSWEGVLEAGESATITYTATYTGDGNQQLDNMACIPENESASEDESCDTVEIPGSGLSVSKESNPSTDPLETGSHIDYTLWFTNEGQAAADVDHTDYIGYVTDDATIIDGPAADEGDLTATLTGDNIRVVGSVPAGESYSITYRVEINPEADRGDNLLVNHLLEGEPEEPPTPPVPGEECVDTATTTCNPVGLIEYEKTVSGDEPLGTGSTLTYEVTISNTGEAIASVDREDVLTDVLDDADLTADPVSDTDSVTVSDVEDEHFTIEGTLEAGETATVTYEVTLKAEEDRGNNEATNFLVTPGEEPPVECETGDSQCTTTLLPKIEPQKTVDPESGSVVTEGDVLTYTLTFANTGDADGEVDYTDSLGDVLDDADLTDGPTSSSDSVDFTITSAEPGTDELRVTGEIAAGETVTVTYEVTVKPDGERGDNQLGNFLVRTGEEPPTECDPETGVCTENPVAEIGAWKTVESDETPVRAGTVLTYTLHFENTGEGDGDVHYVDDLTHVTDDAAVTTEPSSEDDLTTDRDGNQITVTGPLAAGDTATATYQVTVNADGERGDDTAANFLLKPGPDGEVPPVPTDPVCQPEDGERPDCTITPIGQVLTAKAVSASETPVQEGTVLTYTLTFDNQSETGAVVDHTDVLTDVLDDATMTTQPVASDDALTVTDIENDEFTISGEVASGETITVTYEVTVNSEDERGNNSANNFLVPAGEDPPDECEDGDANCSETPLPRIAAGKGVDPESGSTVVEGDVLTYTLTFTNTGNATGPLDYSDDLTGVLDDATITEAPTASSDAVTVTSNDEGVLRATGEIPAGETVTVTYEVTVKPDGERGDNQLLNSIVKTGTDECIADEDAECSTENPVPHIVSAKTSDPASGTPVVSGDELTYTLTFTNEGKATGEVAQVDDLTHVLDDADLKGEPAVSDSALTVDRDGNIIAIGGELNAGQSETVTYTVKVRDAEERGDDVLANYLLDPGIEPPVEPVCEPGEGENPECTTHSVGEISATKTVDPETGTHVADGQELTYTLSFSNTGQGLTDVDFIDHLGDVLDDATLTGEPAASEGLSVTGPEDDALIIAGEVQPGETATVTYTVQVKEYAKQGNHNLGNFLTLSGQEPPAQCVDENPLCTDNPVDPPKPSPVKPPKVDLPRTGSESLLAGLGGLLLLGAGGALVMSRRALTK